MVHTTVSTQIDDCFVLLQASTSEEVEERTDLGLVKGHAYGITAVKRIPLGETSLITLFK